MYQELEQWNKTKQVMKSAEQAKKKAQQEFDKWMTKIIKRNGVTQY